MVPLFIIYCPEFSFSVSESFLRPLFVWPNILLVTPGGSVSIVPRLVAGIPHYSWFENYLEAGVSLREIDWKLSYNKRENQRKQ